RGPRDLDHDVGTVAFLPEATRLLDRPFRIPREAGADLDRHEAVVAAGRIEDAAEHVGGGAHVVDRERLEHASRRLARARAADVGVVEGASGDRLLEARGIRGHAGQAVLVDQAREPPARDEVAPDVVVPDALSERVQSLQQIRRHVYLPEPRSRRANATTCSAVNPYSRITTSPGADAPYRSTPIEPPPSPTYFCHPRVTPASIDSR